MICPVTGKSCGMPKNVIINEIIDGHAKTIRLCHQCAPAYLNSEKMSIPLQLPILNPHNPQHANYSGQPATPGQFLAEILAYFQGQQGKPPMAMPQQVNVCPSCGISFAEIQKIGRMGCPMCYTQFKDQMDIAVQQIHDSNQHVGKAPKLKKVELEKLTVDEQLAPQTPPSKVDEYIKIFEQKMAEAISEERFEDCTKLRDVIRALKNIKSEKAKTLAELQVAAENEDSEAVQRLSGRIADLSKEFASLIMTAME